MITIEMEPSRLTPIHAMANDGLYCIYKMSESLSRTTVCSHAKIYNEL